MNDRPDEATLAAIAAAYAIVVRARITATPPPAVPRWRLAARVELDDAWSARVAARRSAWRAGIGP